MHKAPTVTHDSDFHEFPKMLYRLGDVNQQLVVHSQAEEDAAGPLWYDEILGTPDAEPEPTVIPADGGHSD